MSMIYWQSPSNEVNWLLFANRTAMKKVLNEIISLISANQMVDKILLFGSRARGDATERSDIDIAVICPKMPEKDWVRLWSSIEQTDTLLEIDLVRYDQSPMDLQQNIIREGKILYERNKS